MYVGNQCPYTIRFLGLDSKISYPFSGLKEILKWECLPGFPSKHSQEVQVRFPPGYVQQHFSKVYQIVSIFFISTRGGVRMKMPSVNSQNVSHFISASSSPTPCLLMAPQPHI